VTLDDIKKYEVQRNTRIIQAVIGLVGVVFVVSLNFWYTAHSQDVNNQKWCSLMTSLDDRYQSLPRDAAPEAKQFAIQIHDLREGFHCAHTVPPVTPAPDRSPN
jgi:hypothetical protein